MPLEPKVSPDTPMPQGYGFLVKGNAYLTSLCRRKTHAANKTLYVVVLKNVPQGLRAPKWILGEVYTEERATRAKRQAAVEKNDDATRARFSAAIRRLYPKIPEPDLHRVTKQALQKRSGRVGRTEKLKLDDKVRLAVTAHVRHCHTSYDMILRRSEEKQEARERIHSEVQRILGEWRGGAGNQTPPTRSRKNKKNSRVKKSAAKADQKPKATSLGPRKTQMRVNGQSDAKGLQGQAKTPGQKQFRMPIRASAHLSSNGAHDFQEMDDFLDDSDSAQEDGAGADQEYLVISSDAFSMDDTDEEGSDGDWVSD